MLCTNCNMTRAGNEAPCQHCGAPSPLVKVSYDGGWNWGDNAPAAPGQGSWNNAGTGNLTGGASWGSYPAGNNSNNGSGVAWNNANGMGNAGASWNNSNNGSGVAWNNANPAGGTGASWNNSNNGSGVAWGNVGVPQTDFDTPPGYVGGNGSGFNYSAPRVPTGDLQAQPQSMLPALYQGGAVGMPNEGRRTTMSLQLLPDQMAEQLLPAIPDDQSIEEMIFVAPMYTKARPIIPRYRAISGLLSVIIVALLLCTGVGYYAQASGKINAVRQFLTGANVPPPNLQTTPAAKIPDPRANPDFGPAANVISSAATTSRIDPNTKIAVVSENIFQPKQKFFLTFTVQSQNQDGTIVTQWYTNGHLLTSIDKTIKKADFQGKPQTGVVEMAYALPSEGIVELYWNNKLAMRLYFAVR
jgi:hypothetical protein